MLDARRLMLILLGVTAPALASDGTEDAAETARLEAARAELLAEFTPPRAADPDEAAMAAQLARERDKLDELRPVETLFALSIDGERAGAKVRLRAWHDELDIATQTVETDGAGVARLRLPRGEWLVLVSGQPDADTVLFGSVKVDVERDGDVPIALDTPCRLAFRRRGGEAAVPDRVVLATEDHRHRMDVQPGGARLLVRRPSATPFVVQSLQIPGSRSGFLVRTTVDGEAADVEAGAEGTTKLTFEGAPAHAMKADLGPTDVLRSPFQIETRRRAALYVTGLSEIGVSYEVTEAHGTHRFYPAPLTLDGTARTFRGRAPFDVSVGIRHNTSGRFRDRRNTVSFRVFLREENGLIMRGFAKNNPFPVEWWARVGDEEIKSGAMNGYWRTRLPAMTKEQREQLRFDLRAPTAGLTRKTEAIPQNTQEIARVGLVRVHGCPQLAQNARAWAKWASELTEAFKDARHVRPSHLDVLLWLDTMPGLSGLGGWNGRRSWAQFTDSRLFGFTWPPEKNDGTVSHEFTHAWHMASHGTTFQRIQSRAVRRMRNVRTDVHRVPAGNAFMEGLSALPEQLEGPDEGPLPTVGAASNVTSSVDEDAFVVWYLRRKYGRDAVVKRRVNAATYAYWLVLGGYTDDEARAGVLSFFAKENLAWLVRLRGGDVTDARADAAWNALANNEIPKPLVKERRAVGERWKAFKPEAAGDLDEAMAKASAEVGTWSKRAELRLAAARHLGMSGDHDAMGRHLQAALADSWRTGRSRFESTLTKAAQILIDTRE